MFKKIIKGFDEQGSCRNAFMPGDWFVGATGSTTLPVLIANVGGPA